MEFFFEKFKMDTFEFSKIVKIFPDVDNIEISLVENPPFSPGSFEPLVPIPSHGSVTGSTWAKHMRRGRRKYETGLKTLFSK